MDPSVEYLSVEFINLLYYCSLEELEALAKFKEELLTDKRLWRARPIEMKGKEYELRVISFEIWRRKLLPVLASIKEKIPKIE